MPLFTREDLEGMLRDTGGVQIRRTVGGEVVTSWGDRELAPEETGEMPGAWAGEEDTLVYVHEAFPDLRSGSVLELQVGGEESETWDTVEVIRIRPDQADGLTRRAVLREEPEVEMV